MKNHKDTRGIEGSNLSGRIPYTEGEARLNYQEGFCQKCNAWRGSLGLEPTPELYISHLVQVFREIWRVGRPDCTVWLNMGDSYATHNSGGKGYKHNFREPDVAQKEGISQVKPTAKSIGLKEKDLCMIPARVALALQADGWWLRSDIIWSKPNPMPESVTDRPTRSHEYVFLLTKAARYFYDADAVREKSTYGPGCGWEDAGHEIAVKTANVANPAFRAIKPTRNLRSVWQTATQPFPDAHFATFPEKLVEPCIKAGTSEKGCCPECGAPWIRIVKKPEIPEDKFTKTTNPNDELVAGHRKGGVFRGSGQKMQNWLNENPSKTIGWKPSCECQNVSNHVIPCTVLDPFGGSGRTAIVANKLGRRCIIIELKEEYCSMPLDEFRQENIF